MSSAHGCGREYKTTSLCRWVGMSERMSVGLSERMSVGLNERMSAGMSEDACGDECGDE